MATRLTNLTGSFHFSLNANLSGVRHYAGPEDFNNPTCLRRAASVVNGRTWNVTHSVYNTSRELREIKLVAHVLDYFRLVHCFLHDYDS